MFRSLIIILFPCSVFAVGPVYDAANYGQLTKVINQGTKHLSKLDSIDSEMSSINSMLGSSTNNTVLESYNQQISDLIYKTNLLSSGNLYALGSVFESPASVDNWKDLSWNMNEVKTNLYPEKEDGKITFEEIDRVQENRAKVFTGSTKSSLALAETKQASVEETQEIVKEISVRAKKSKNIHGDLNNANQSLVIIANELIQIRQLLAKQLEITSSMYLSRSSEWLGTPYLSEKSAAKPYKSSYKIPNIDKIGTRYKKKKRGI